MKTQLTARDLIIGSGGAILGGIFVWSLTKNIELGTQLKALEEINPQILTAVSTSSSAKTAAKEAIERANEAIRSAQASEREAKRILTNLQAGPFFEKVDQSIDELREVAREVAKEASKKFLLTNGKSETTEIPQSDFWNSTITNTVGHTCEDGSFLTGIYFDMMSRNEVRTPTKIKYTCTSKIK